MAVGADPHPAAVQVNWKGANRIASGHPWVFSSDVTGRGAAAPGDVVRVLDPRGRLLGVAHFSSTSQITLRLLAGRLCAIDKDFLLRRLRRAAALRGRLVRDTDAFRLVHGEGDLLPGLVVDRYGGYLVMQTLDQGMDRATGLIVECLVELFAPHGILARNDAAVRAHESLPRENAVLHGEIPPTVPVTMNGLVFEADLLHGQKTGVFLDQRENYAAVTSHARGRALDCFTYGGAFALHMARRADSVLAVDSSEEALRLAARNAEANGISNAAFREGDVFDLLAGFVHARRRFEIVVLDPPAFAKSRSSVEGALRGYKEINRRALELLEPGGVLVSCSCSHHVSEAALLEVIAAAALDAGRSLRVLERRTQSMDHPILLTVPETHYLKCVILEAVE